MGPGSVRMAVYCGSSPGYDPSHREIARRTGELIARRGLGLVYGGCTSGLMGALADGALAAGGQVIGVVPGLPGFPEILHPGLTELVEVESMSQRKDEMIAMSEAFLVLPGGMGTLDELFDTLARAQVGEHAKPLGLLDAGGYYQPLLNMLEIARKEGFLREGPESLFHVGDDPEALITTLVGCLGKGSWRSPSP